MNDLKIIDYIPAYQRYFEAFNKAWLEEYFSVEPIDKYVLENPEEAIYKAGGCILCASYQEKIIGTVALKVVKPGVFELTKMAVDKSYRGLGAGKLLCNAAIEKTKTLGAARLILYTDRKLSTALAVYRKLGFKDIELEKGEYERADIMMEYEC